MSKKGGSKSGSSSRRRKLPAFMKVRRADAAPLCDCKCGQPAEIEFAGLFYTKACQRRILDELKAAGIPIEESDEGVRLAPNVRVTIVDEGDPTKVH